MDNKRRIENLAEEKYLVLFGVHKATFDMMLAMLENAYVVAIVDVTECETERPEKNRKNHILESKYVTK